MTYTQFITIGPMRWDNVAYKAYGDPALFAEIIRANFGVPAYDVIPEGTVLRIPIIETEAQSLDVSLLPPWKRGQTDAQATAVAAIPAFANIQSQTPGSFDNSFD